jgi:hypothetical protein
MLRTKYIKYKKTMLMDDKEITRSVITTWAQWRADHPNTLVLDRPMNGEYQNAPSEQYTTYLKYRSIYD